MTTPLGRLTRVDLRDIWETEAQHFTPWLAQTENLEVLADTLKMELELEAQEKNVGPFRADILCKNTDDGSWVLIENQLERTDHGHLGQLLTYAAGLQAVTIIWIADSFTEEHRAALDWLNDITDESFRFFGLEVELWKIGESNPAPKFNIISKPNDWTKSISSAAKKIATGNITEVKLKQLEFWKLLKSRFDTSNTKTNLRKPLPQHWMHIGIGKTGFTIAATLNTKENRIGTELYISDENAKQYFNLLYSDKDKIETDFGQHLDWQELPDKKASRILYCKNNTNPLLEKNWPEYLDWFEKYIIRMDSTFRSRIQQLNPDDWQPEEDVS